MFLSGSGGGFGFEKLELFGGQGLAVGVGDEAVDGAGEVAELEADGAGGGVVLPDLFFGEAGGPVADVGFGLVERAAEEARDGREGGVGAGEPGFHSFMVVPTFARWASVGEPGPCAGELHRWGCAGFSHFSAVWRGSLRPRAPCLRRPEGAPPRWHFRLSTLCGPKDRATPVDENGVRLGFDRMRINRYDYPDLASDPGSHGGRRWS